MGIASAVAGLTRPAETSTSRTGSAHRALGLAAAALGWGLAAAALVISVTTAALIAQSRAETEIRGLAALSFGLAVVGLGTGKTGIALVLWGIVRRIWVRASSLKEALPSLVPSGRPIRPMAHGADDIAHGRVSLAADVPAPLLIHRMARLMWGPMLLMGVMAVYAGLALAYLEAEAVATDAALARSLDAWVKGLQFLGEGFLLSAISFLLGTILGAVRAAGGEVQHSLRVPVKTLAMPATAKAFVGLMMVGLAIEIAQFVGYAHVASLADPAAIATFSTWLGPFREFGLGLLLSGIVLALAAIATALRFQFSRIEELIRDGS